MRSFAGQYCLWVAPVAIALLSACNGGDARVSSRTEPGPNVETSAAADTGDIPSEPGSSMDSVAEVNSVADIQFVLTTFHQVRYPSVTMQAGKSKVYFDCMSREGFDIPGALRPIPTAFPTEATLSLPGQLAFEQQTLSDVQAHAYNPPDSEGDGEPVPFDDGLNDWIMALPEGQLKLYQLADLGDGLDPLVVQTDSGTFQYPTSGCEFEATEAVFGNASDFYNLIAQLNNAESDLFLGANLSVTYQSAIEAWRSCMAASGFDATTPEEMPGDELLRNDVDLAAADWTCRKSENVGDARANALIEQANRQFASLTALQGSATEMISAAEATSIILVE